MRTTGDSGDGWSWCELGHQHWGRYGAAGLLVSHRDEDGVEWILLQLRTRKTQHGGTWGLLGGARRRGDTATMAARREAEEESTIGRDVDVRVTLADGLIKVRVDDHGHWTYTTVFATTDTAPAVSPRGPESEEIRWVRADQVTELDLHPGFAETWSRLHGVAAA